MCCQLVSSFGVQGRRALAAAMLRVSWYGLFLRFSSSSLAFSVADLLTCLILETNKGKKKNSNLRESFIYLVPPSTSLPLGFQ